MVQVHWSFWRNNDQQLLAIDIQTVCHGAESFLINHEDKPLLHGQGFTTRIFPNWNQYGSKYISNMQLRTSYMVTLVPLYSSCIICTTWEWLCHFCSLLSYISKLNSDFSSLVCFSFNHKVFFYPQWSSVWSDQLATHLFLSSVCTVQPVNINNTLEQSFPGVKTSALSHHCLDCYLLLEIHFFCFFFHSFHSFLLNCFSIFFLL